MVYVATWASLVAQSVKNPLAMQDTWIQLLGWEDPLEDSMATHSSIPACMLVQTHEWTKKINGMENRSVTDPKTERLSI